MILISTLTMDTGELSLMESCQKMGFPGGEKARVRESLQGGWARALLSSPPISRARHSCAGAREQGVLCVYKLTLSPKCNGTEP